MRAEYDRRRRLVVDGLNLMGLDTFVPRGAFYAFPRITSTGLDDNAFVERLLEEEHVAAVPGSAFGPSGAGHVRMCYATSYEKLEEALERIGRFVERTRAGAGAGRASAGSPRPGPWWSRPAAAGRWSSASSGRRRRASPRCRGPRAAR